MAPKSDIIQGIADLMTRKTIGNALKAGQRVDEGVVILTVDDAKDILYKALPHLDPNNTAPGVPATISFGIDMESRVFCEVQRIDTGERSEHFLDPAHAVNLGSALIQYGTLAGIGFKPTREPEQDKKPETVPVTIQ